MAAHAAAQQRRPTRRLTRVENHTRTALAPRRREADVRIPCTLPEADSERQSFSPREKTALHPSGDVIAGTSRS